MAFERAKIEIKPASVGTGIKVTLGKVRGADAKMKFSFSASVAKTLGWADGDKIEVMIGNGEHHGLLRMRKNASVGEAVLTHRNALKGGYFALGLGHQPMFVDRSEPGRWCQFEIVEDGFVEIVLPKWADETGPTKQKIAVSPLPNPLASKPPVQTAPAQAKRSVTSNLMGDPPLGRREMLAKMGEMKA
jgi:hypothetical protein